ncbi:MAG: hypothetical protein KF708_22725 [Pirellulales bacterium]|nr:hypothetical protein [Pirellulales bacterium]
MSGTGYLTYNSAPPQAPRRRVSTSSSAHCPLITDHSPAKGRRGISLTEVLLSMFVMTVGILGLAALIPVGGSDVATAVRNDRTSNLGRAAFRDVQVRDWLNQNNWLDPDAGTAWRDMDMPDGTNETIPFETSPLDYGNAVCLDPMFLARAVPEGTPIDRRWGFPYRLDNNPDPDNDHLQSLNPPRMQRVALRAWPGSTLPMSLAQTERLFRSSDDLVFGLPDNQPDGRPFASLGTAGQVRQYTGDYSWMVTIAPYLNEHTANLPAAERPQSYIVSTVVFQKRIVELAPEDIGNRVGTPPTERLVYCDFMSGIGLGGGDVRLRLPVGTLGNNDPNQPKNSDFPAVKPGQWIMLSAWLLPGNGVSGAVFRWYRVVSAGPLTSAVSGGVVTEWYQDVTLSGPDFWRSSVTVFGSLYADADDLTPPSGKITVYATIVDGVVGVYEKTMRLDTRAFGVR